MRMKLPSLGWMTLRFTPMWPRPASTAIGLTASSHGRAPGSWGGSMGNPIGTDTPRTPRSARVVTTVAAASTSCSWFAFQATLATARETDRTASGLVVRTRTT